MLIFLLLIPKIFAFSLKADPAQTKLVPGRQSQLLPFTLSHEDPSQLFHLTLNCTENIKASIDFCQRTIKGTTSQLNDFFRDSQRSFEKSNSTQFSISIHVFSPEKPEISARASNEFTLYDKIQLIVLNKTVSRTAARPKLIAKVLPPFDKFALAFEIKNGSSSDLASKYQDSVEIITSNFTTNRTIFVRAVDPISGLESKFVEISVKKSREKFTFSHSFWIMLLIMGVLALFGSFAFLGFWLLRKFFNEKNKGKNGMELSKKNELAKIEEENEEKNEHGYLP